MGRRKKREWYGFLYSLTVEQKTRMLEKILDWQIDELGVDGDIQFREPEYDDTEGNPIPPDFYWGSCGDSLLEE